MNTAILLIEEECEAPTHHHVQVTPAPIPKQIEEALEAFKEIRDRITHITIVSAFKDASFVLHSETLRQHPG